jgi:hypothetical protein
MMLVYFARGCLLAFIISFEFFKLVENFPTATDLLPSFLCSFRGVA